MSDLPKVLYVDDEAINLDNFVRVFELDFAVCTALSGEEALKLFTENNPGFSVVVSDQRMEGMSGVDLLTEIYAIDPDPARIILTAYADFKDLTEAVNKGHIYQYVQKPWDYRTLKAILLRGAEACAMARNNRRLVRELAQRNLDLHTANERLEEELYKNKLAEEKRREVEILMLSQAKLASLGEMATGIAHEINQPLSYIRILLQAARQDYQNGCFEVDGFMEDVDEGLAQISRISTIIDHMRTFGRAEVMDRCRLFLPDVINHALVPLRQRLRLSNIKLKVEAADDLPMISGVPVQLEQVVINLISNAVDALETTEDKQIAIRLSVRKNELVMEFADNGCGMPERVVRKIFEPFFTTKEVGKGTGIGLAISYGIIREHKGMISCRSVEGEGTVFTVTLPLDGGGESGGLSGEA